MKEVSKIILINDKKEILLYLRDEKKEIPYPGYWDFIGGGVDPGENFLEPIKREVKEEINLSFSNIIELGKIFVKKDKLCNEDVFIFLFKAKINITAEKIKLNEGQRLKYFELKDILNLKFPEFLKMFLLKNKSKIFD